jgi:hypothetical protein
MAGSIAVKPVSATVTFSRASVFDFLDVLANHDLL